MAKLKSPLASHAVWESNFRYNSQYVYRHFFFVTGKLGAQIIPREIPFIAKGLNMSDSSKNAELLRF